MLIGFFWALTPKSRPYNLSVKQCNTTVKALLGLTPRFANMSQTRFQLLNRIANLLLASGLGGSITTLVNLLGYTGTSKQSQTATVALALLSTTITAIGSYLAGYLKATRSGTSFTLDFTKGNKA